MSVDLSCKGCPHDEFDRISGARGCRIEPFFPQQKQKQMFKLLLSILPFTVYGLPGSPADSMIQDQMVFGVRGQKKVADVQLAERETKTTFPLCADVRGASCSAVVEEKYLGAW